MRISDFAFAIGVSAKAVAAWLEKGQAFTHARTEPGAYASFNDRDVAEGALLVEIMRAINVPVRTGGEIVDRIVRPKNIPHPKRTPRKLFGGKFVVLMPGEPKWRVGLIPKDRIGDMKDGPVRVVIDADHIIDAALARSAERAKARAMLAQKAGREAA